MNLKMIVTDLDRTLLRSDHTISEYTFEILTRYRKHGIKVVFATARPKNRVDELDIADLADVIILNNGSAVYHDEISETKFGIDAHTVKDIVHQLKSEFHDMRMWVVYSDRAYKNCDVSDYWAGTSYDGFDNLPDIPADKICLRAGKEIFQTIREHLPETLYAQLIRDPLIFIANKLATKWNATCLLAKELQINNSEIVCFGDDFNDLEMLKNCGIGVAVSNALNEVKAVSDYVCGTNDEDGVAKWLDENVL
ncbi:MAG: HAD family hydrolase [Oscillospiraceae bacterium]|jgi:Cof subfamily protein (haloacid dehalogenase superfamily)|nr:HAD family hydrolase [Oscillospiraceae bacterium]